MSRPMAVSVLALALGGCAQMHGVRLGVGEAPTVIGPAVRDNRTPMDAAFACFAPELAAQPRRLVIGVGDVRDYTGKYSVNEGNAITQGGALMVTSALGKLGGAVNVAERFDPVIAERELGYTDRRQLGDGQVHDVVGPTGPGKAPWLPYYGGSIAASDYYIVGGITELNYDVHSGGVDIGISQLGPKARTFTQSVAIDLRIVDTRSLLVIKTVSLTKQFTGYEVGFNIFRFFGSDLFDVDLGAKAQEPLQLGIRTALEEATLRLVGAAAKVDPAPCLSRQSWLASIGPAPIIAVASPPPTAPGHVPINALVETAPPSGGLAIRIPFDLDRADLAGAAVPLIDQIVAAAAKGPVEVGLVSPDAESPDPGKRDALTDKRLSSLIAALAARGIAAGLIATLWRPGPSDAVVHRDGAGLQDIARLRIGR